MKMKTKKWADVLTIVNGRNQKKVENIDGKYPIYGSGGIMSYADDYICPENTVIIGRKGSINNPIFVSEKFWNVDTAFGLVADKKILNPKYLYYFCKRYNFNKLNTTVTIPSLTKEKLKKIQIPIPENIDNQIRIANLLSQVESLISKREESIKLLNELLKSTFLDIFGDPVLNPNGWNKKMISNCCLEIVDCVNRTAPIMDYQTDYKMIRTTNVRNYQVSLHGARSVDKETYEKWIRRLKPQKNDIVFTREAPVGESGIIATDDNVFLGQRTMLYRVNEKLINPTYLLFELMGSNIQRQIKKISTGSTVKHLSVPNCKKFKLNVPPKLLQDKFDIIVQQVEQTKQQHQRSLKELKNLFGSLSQRAFRGELDLRGMEIK